MAFLINPEVEERVRRLEIAFDRHGIDRFGISQRPLARFFTVLSWFYRRYFDTTVNGIDHVPPRGRAMLVGNHSGGVALDGAMVLASLFLDMDPPRLGQGMAEKFLNRVPFASTWTNRLGQLTGLPEHALSLLEDERLLMVFPEGARGTAKLYGDRNSLVEFGTGFVRLALRTRTPIIPFAFLGGGDAIPTVVNLVRLGHLFGAPYVPVTPWLLPVPRPVRLEIYYDEPFLLEGTGNEEDEVIHGHVERIKDRIAALIETGASIRRGRGEAVR
ncbi:MAG TPA: lysophospholipid acyltransferase family protein [Kofleriaceae bacterium]|nr:lysophospholipid acyltransferase family protein [Kofleriaceae bacterium]